MCSIMRYFPIRAKFKLKNINLQKYINTFVATDVTLYLFGSYSWLPVT